MRENMRADLKWTPELYPPLCILNFSELYYTFVNRVAYSGEAYENSSLMIMFLLLIQATPTQMRCWGTSVQIKTMPRLFRKSQDNLWLNNICKLRRINFEKDWYRGLLSDELLFSVITHGTLIGWLTIFFL